MFGKKQVVRPFITEAHTVVEMTLGLSIHSVGFVVAGTFSMNNGSI